MAHRSIINGAYFYSPFLPERVVKVKALRRETLEIFIFLPPPPPKKPEERVVITRTQPLKILQPP